MRTWRLDSGTVEDVVVVGKPVSFVTYSPDGSKVAAIIEGSVYIWLFSEFSKLTAGSANGTTNQQPIIGNGIVKRLSGAILLQFSGDSKQLAVATHDGDNNIIVTVDCQTGNILYEFEKYTRTFHHSNLISALSYNHDNTRLYSHDLSSNTIAEWNTTNGKFINKINNLSNIKGFVNGGFTSYKLCCLSIVRVIDGMDQYEAYRKNIDKNASSKSIIIWDPSKSTNNILKTLTVTDLPIGSGSSMAFAMAMTKSASKCAVFDPVSFNVYILDLTQSDTEIEFSKTIDSDTTDTIIPIATTTTATSTLTTTATTTTTAAATSNNNNSTTTPTTTEKKEIILKPIINCFALLPDKKTVITGSSNGVITLWDTLTWKILKVIKHANYNGNSTINWQRILLPRQQRNNQLEVLLVGSEDESLGTIQYLGCAPLYVLNLTDYSLNYINKVRISWLIGLTWCEYQENQNHVPITRHDIDVILTNWGGWRFWDIELFNTGATFSKNMITKEMKHNQHIMTNHKRLESKIGKDVVIFKKPEKEITNKKKKKNDASMNDHVLRLKELELCWKITSSALSPMNTDFAIGTEGSDVIIYDIKTFEKKNNLMIPTSFMDSGISACVGLSYSFVEKKLVSFHSIKGKNKVKAIIWDSINYSFLYDIDIDNVNKFGGGGGLMTYNNTSNNRIDTNHSNLLTSATSHSDLIYCWDNIIKEKDYIQEISSRIIIYDCNSKTLLSEYHVSGEIIHLDICHDNSIIVNVKGLGLHVMKLLDTIC